MKKPVRLAFLLGALLVAGTPSAAADDNIKRKTYNNPVIERSVPDPTVIKCEEDGFFYLYGTEDIGNGPIFRSKNLIDWSFVGTVFNSSTRPKSLTPTGRGNLWAPDINYVNGQYVYYYSIGVWGHGDISGFGVATADRPEGPFVDRGTVVMPAIQGVNNSIDQFYIEDNGKKYIAWGSFNGIYMMELTDDALRIKPGAQKIQLAGSLTEGTYIYKRDGYYYLFGSAGSCCEGANSTYRVVVARSTKLEGPYVNKSGGLATNNQFETILEGDDFVAGPGHNAEFMEDDNGDTWMIYHGYVRDRANEGRMVFLDKVQWKDGWPYFEGGHASRTSAAPYFKDQQ